MKKYKEILIFVAGQTPQIITETIYALAKKDPPIKADEIYIITTRLGRSRIVEELIKGGILEDMAKDLRLPRIPLFENSFFITTDIDGNLLDDIRLEADNRALGDLICKVVREKSGNSESRLHCSIAGGRKTMSFYMGAALQLFGRPWDKLYHVLVTPEFESLKDFYYKPAKDRLINCLAVDGPVIKKLNTREAEIQLSELPFIRLRDKLTLEGKDFAELTQTGQKDIDDVIFQPLVKVNLQNRGVAIGEKSIEMAPGELILYCYFLRQKQKGCVCPKKTYCKECTDCFKSLKTLQGNRELIEDLYKDLDVIYGPHSMRAEGLIIKWEKGFDAEILRAKISKINRTLKQGLSNNTLHTIFQVTAVGRYGAKRYGVKVEKGRIRIQ